MLCIPLAPDEFEFATNGYNLIPPGVDYELKCISKIKPFTVTWYKDGQPVDLSLERFSVHSNQRKQYLIIHNSQEGNATEGKYTCTIKSDIGTTNLGRDIQIVIECRLLLSLSDDEKNSLPVWLKID